MNGNKRCLTEQQKKFEGLKRKDTVTILPVTDEDKILLGKQEQPGSDSFIGGFGGRIENNESVLEAAKRELLEETGYTAKNWELWFSTQPNSRIDYADYVFIAKKIKKTDDTRLESGEKIEIIEVDFDEFLQYTKQNNFRNSTVALKLYQNSSKEEMIKIRKLFNP